MSAVLEHTDHVGYTVSDLDRSVHQTFERLRGRAELRSADPVLIEWGPYEGGYAARVRDPDGITIELVQPPEGGVKL
jgi:hypothetical protein